MLGLGVNSAGHAVSFFLHFESGEICLMAELELFAAEDAIHMVFDVLLAPIVRGHAVDMSRDGSMQIKGGLGGGLFIHVLLGFHLALLPVIAPMILYRFRSRALEGKHQAARRFGLMTEAKIAV